jgi:hypothetical protein
MRLRLDGDLNIHTLEQTLGEVLRRHEVLRMVFAAPNGSPIPVVHEPERWRLPVVDLSQLNQQARQETAQRIALEEGRKPFDLSKGPLVRSALVRSAQNECMLLCNMHHIVTDGWSNGLLVREVSSLYESFRNGWPSALPELPVQYLDYANWQRETLQGEALQEQVDYWRGRLADAPPVLDLPFDRSRPAVQTFTGDHIDFQLSAELLHRLTKLSFQEETTLFMTLLAAFNTLLYRYTGQDDVVVGTNVAGRNVAEI